MRLTGPIGLSGPIAARKWFDHSERARLELIPGWAQARQFDLQAPFDDDLVLPAAHEGRFDDAARLTAYADAGNALFGERESNEVTAHARAVQLARGALGDDASDRRYAEGDSLRDVDIEVPAFGEGNADLQLASFATPGADFSIDR